MQTRQWHLFLVLVVGLPLKLHSSQGLFFPKTPILMLRERFLIAENTYENFFPHFARTDRRFANLRYEWAVPLLLCRCRPCCAIIILARQVLLGFLRPCCGGQHSQAPLQLLYSTVGAGNKVIRSYTCKDKHRWECSSDHPSLVPWPSIPPVFDCLQYAYCQKLEVWKAWERGQTSYYSAVLITVTLPVH